jgi:hypothetical protein
MIRGVFVLGLVGIAVFKLQVPDNGPVCIFDYCAPHLPAGAAAAPAQRLADMKQELRAAPPPLAAISAALLPPRRRPNLQDQ